MKTDIDWAELHSPLFLAGTNLGQKLDPRKRCGLKMQFDEEKRHLYVSYAGCTARVPEPSILSMVEQVSTPKVVEPTAPVPPPGLYPAQADSPTSHVFAGKGKGRTGFGGKDK